MEECSNEKNQTCDDSVRNASSTNAVSNNKQKSVDGGGSGSCSNASAEDEDKKSTEDSQKAPHAGSMVSLATPLLIEDICGELVPASYSTLLAHLHDASASAHLLQRFTNNDIVVLFIYVIMLEEGFVPAHCAHAYRTTNVGYNRQQVIELCTQIPPTWKRSANLYEIAFVFGCFDQFVCKLLCSTCMQDLVVNCMIYGIPNGNYSMMVDSSQYIVDSRTNLCKRYQNIKQFATNFKNLIGNPAKFDILQANNLQTPTLQDLPPELKMHLEKMVKVNFFQDL